MPARFTAYPPDQAALVRILEDDTVYTIGRVSECELCIEHPSVSRRHAELVGTSGDPPSWKLHDIGSKNGLRVDGHLTLKASFTATVWFAVGDVYCWLELIGGADVAKAFARDVDKRANSRQLSARFTPKLDIGTLIPQALDVVLELSGLERGFVLYAPAGEPLRVRASRGIQIGELSKASFSGSATAVDQALAKHHSVVCCDTNDSPWLGLQPSVRLGGIRALVCVPLQLSDGSSGVIYVDSRMPGPPVTQLDLELIENVANHASNVLAVSLLQGEVDRLLASTAEIDELAPRWDELRAF
ncbi:MAG: FHA domain-containing protein [Rudaea sp.]